MKTKIIFLLVFFSIFSLSPLSAQTKKKRFSPEVERIFNSVVAEARRNANRDIRYNPAAMKFRKYGNRTMYKCIYDLCLVVHVCRVLSLRGYIPRSEADKLMQAYNQEMATVNLMAQQTEELTYGVLALTPYGGDMGYMIYNPQTDIAREAYVISTRAMKETVVTVIKSSKEAIEKRINRK